MKNNLFLVLLLSIFVWSACSNEFDVSAPWKDIPVVYGLLDADQDVHYIRVEKAFLDPDRNALDDAQIPDSLYYENLTVQLRRVSNDALFNMTRVNGNDLNIGLQRDPGIFAEDPNYLYRIGSSEINLEEGETIELIIDRGENKPLVTATTVVQGPMLKRTPLGNNFDFVPNLPTTLGWSASPEAKIFDAKLIINYAEFPKDDPSAFVEKSFDWVWGQGVTFPVFENEYKLQKEGIDFFSVMASNIADDPNFERIFIDIELEVTSGGEELESYVNVALANSGITGSQELPSYSNLSEGMGIFSTRSTLRSTGLLLTTRTRDSLINGSITAHLNFQ